MSMGQRFHPPIGVSPWPEESRNKPESTLRNPHRLRRAAATLRRHTRGSCETVESTWWAWSTFNVTLAGRVQFPGHGLSDLVW
jgi:hypothetical protein